MTVAADSKSRVTLRRANPGDRFDVQISADGKYILPRQDPVRDLPPRKIRIEKRGRYRVGVLDRPISKAALKEALEKFP